MGKNGAYFYVYLCLNGIFYTEKALIYAICDYILGKSLTHLPQYTLDRKVLINKAFAVFFDTLKSSNGTEMGQKFKLS